MTALVILSQYNSLVPPLSTEEYDSLKESIQRTGQWMPIIVNKNEEILDGHHRFRICQELDIKPKTKVISFSSKTDEIIFVGECNLKRRQLTTLQKITLIKQLEPFYKQQAQERMKSGKKSDPTEICQEGETAEILGKKAGVSGKTYSKASKILDNASKEDIESINKGEKSISSVYQNIAETNHFKLNLKKPYSFSLPVDMIRGIQYYKRTVPGHHLDQKVEDFIDTIVPRRSIQ